MLPGFSHVERTPIIQKLHRRLVAQRRVPARPVVEHLSVLEARHHHFCACGITQPMDPLILKTVKLTLGWRVIPTISLATHGALRAVGRQLVLEGLAGVLAPPIRVMHQPHSRFPSEPRHRQRVGHDVRCQAGFARPAHHFVVEQVKHNRQVELAFILPQIGDVRCQGLVRGRWREVSFQPVRRHRQVVRRVRRHLVPSHVARTDAVLPHQLLNPFLAGWGPAPPQLPDHSRGAVGAFECRVNGADQRQHLGVCQPRAIRRAALLPGAIAAFAHRQDRTHLVQGVARALHVHPGVRHSVSLAKYAVAFVRISFSRFSRTFSARSRDSSICSGVTTVAPAPLSVPPAAALPQFRRVCSTSPNSLAAAPAVNPSLTRFTANSLNSIVYCCFGIFIVLPFMVIAMIRHSWKTKFRGKLRAECWRDSPLRSQIRS